MTQISIPAGSIKVTEKPNIREYRLMYVFGAWITREKIYAETDNEAVFDADAAFRDSGLESWRYGVALFRGNKLIKTYK